jgi:AcrR family transcriptional regulator
MAKRRWLNREVVVETAVALANEAGSAEAVSLTALAGALDVRVPSLYNHVANLEDLQRGTTLWAARRLVETLREAAAGLVGREALLAMADAYRRFAQANRGVYLLTVRAPGPEDVEWAAIAQELLQLMLLVFASYGLAGEKALHAVRGMRAVLHGFVALEAAEGFKMDLDVNDSFQRLVVVYVEGLRGGE